MAWIIAAKVQEARKQEGTFFRSSVYIDIYTF